MPSVSKSKTGEAKMGKKKAVMASSLTGNGYGPLSGGFHILDYTDPNTNKIKSYDDSSSLGTSENDSVSNNGSSAGETAEDPVPSKPTPYIPGMEAVPDKQEKIRLKNERKHQRQRERKAKEVRERCHSYLMTRKLEKLAEQLVSMGFSREKATTALIVTDGDVERSISFLVEDEQVSREEVEAKALKVDISEEIARMAELEKKLGCPHLEIERAVVACEGDIDGAIRWLRSTSTASEVKKQAQPQRRMSATEELASDFGRSMSLREPVRTGPTVSPLAMNFREPPSAGLTASSYPLEHLGMSFREPSTTLTANNYSPDYLEPHVASPAVKYREPPGIMNSASRSSPREAVAALPGGTFPHSSIYQDLGGQPQQVPRTYRPPITPYDNASLQAWTLQEPPRRNVYTDWRNSHPSNPLPSLAVSRSMNRLDDVQFKRELGSPFYELYDRSPPSQTSRPMLHPLHNAPERVPRGLSYSQGAYDRSVPSPLSEFYEERIPPSPLLELYDRIPSAAVSRRVVAPATPPGYGGGSTWSDGAAWNVERAKSVDYKSIDWSMDGPVSFSPLRNGFTKDILL